MFLDKWEMSKLIDEFKWPDDVCAMKLSTIERWSSPSEGERRTLIQRALDVYNIHISMLFLNIFVASSSVMNFIFQLLNQALMTNRQCFLY